MILLDPVVVWQGLHDSRQYRLVVGSTGRYTAEVSGKDAMKNDSWFCASVRAEDENIVLMLALQKMRELVQ